MKISIQELNTRWIENNNLMVLLPLLEYSYPDILEDLKEIETISKDTLTELVEYSLRFPSRHWALSAVVWIENGFIINSKICDSLLTISTDKSDSQKLRHKSFAQAKRWQKSQLI